METEEQGLTDWNMAKANFIRLNQALTNCNQYSSINNHKEWFNSGLSVLYRELSPYFIKIKDKELNWEKEAEIKFNQCQLLISNPNKKVDFFLVYNHLQNFEIFLRKTLKELKMDFPKKDMDGLALGGNKW